MSQTADVQKLADMFSTLGYSDRVKFMQLTNTRMCSDSDSDSDSNEFAQFEKHYTRLTVDLIKKYFWDPVAKKGRPITFFYAQDLVDDYDYTKDMETLTPTGNLIIGIGSSVIVEKDWLSTSINGPYFDDGSNSSTLYFLEFEEELQDSCDNKVQIGFNGFSKYIENNYLSVDAVDSVDCWVKREIKCDFDVLARIFDIPSGYAV